MFLVVCGALDMLVLPLKKDFFFFLEKVIIMKYITYIIGTTDKIVVTLTINVVKEHNNNTIMINLIILRLSTY